MRKSTMEKLRKMSKTYYLRQIVSCLLVYCILLAVPAQIALADSNPAANAHPSVGSYAATPGGSAVWDGANTTTITAPHGSVFDWTNFDIGSDQIVQHLQGASDWAVLHRINVALGDGAITGINGQLLAPGNVFVVNPQGIVVGSEAFVSVNGFLAAGFGMSKADFQNIISNPNQKMIFTGANGDVVVLSGGTINAHDVYLVGKNVTNNGTISCPGGLVVMAAGDTVKLRQPGSSTIINLGQDLVAPSNSVNNNGDGVEADKLVLAAGDVWSQAISNVGKLAAYADNNIDIEGNVTTGGSILMNAGSDIEVDGDVVSTGGQIDLYSSDETTKLHGDVQAKYQVSLHNRTELAGDGDQRIESVNNDVVAFDVEKTTSGNLTFAAADGISLRGDVATADGDLTFEDAVTADGEGSQKFDSNGQDKSLYALDSITKTFGYEGGNEGDLTLEADNDVQVEGDVALSDGVTGNMVIRADADGDNEGDVDVGGNIYNPGGTIDIYASDNTIYLGGDWVEAADDVTLHDNTVLDGAGNQRIESTSGKLTAEASVHKTTTGSLNMVGGVNSDISVDTRGVRVDDGALHITGNAAVQLGGDIYSTGRMELFSNDDEDGSGGYLYHYAGTIQSLYGDVDMEAVNDYIYLYGGNSDEYVTAGGDILLYSNTQMYGDRKLDAADDVVLAGGKNLNTVTGGDLTIEAGDDIILGAADTDHHWVAPWLGYAGNVTHNYSGDLILDAGDDVYAHGTLSTKAGSGGAITVTAVDNINLYATPTSANADGTLTLAADSGDVTVAGDLYGNMTMSGVNVTVEGNVESHGTLDVDADEDIRLKSNVSSVGEMTMDAGDDIELNENSGNTTSNSNMALTAGKTNNWGDVEAWGTLITTDAENGNLTVSASDNIRLHATATSADAAGELQLLADTDNDLDGGDVVVDGALYGNMTMSGVNVTVEGDVESHGTLDVDADEDIRLKSNVSSVGEMTMDAGDDIKLNRTLGDTSSESTIALNAGDDIVIGTGNPSSVEGNVTANGDMEINAGSDSCDDVTVYGKLTTTNGGNIIVTAGDDIKLYGTWSDDIPSVYESAEADGTLTLTAGDDVYAHGNLIATNGDIEIYSSDSTTYLYSDLVHASGNVLLNNEVELKGTGDQRIEATAGTLDANKNLNKPTNGSLTLAGGSGIELAGNIDTDGGDLIFENAVTADGVGNQEFDAGGSGAKLISNSTIDKTTAGDLTLDGGYWFDVIELGGDVTVHDGSLFLGEQFGWMSDDTSISANGKLKASQDVTVYGDLTGKGALTVEADNNIMLYQSVKASDEADGDLILHADYDNDNVGNADIRGNIYNPGGKIDIYASDDTIYLGGDWVEATDDITLHANTELNSNDDQRIESTSGKLTAEGTVLKTGWHDDLELIGGYNGLRGTDDYSVWMQDDVTVEKGGLDIIGNSSVRLDGSLDSKGDMHLTANNDELPSGDNQYLVHYGGTIKSRCGDVVLTAKGDVIYLDSSDSSLSEYVSAGEDIKLNDHVWVQYDAKLDAGDDVYLADGKNIQANHGLVVEADDDIKLGADSSQYPWMGGAAGNVTTREDLVLDAGGEIYAYGNLTSDEGSIDIYSSNHTTYLYEDVTAYENVTLNNTTELRGVGTQRIEASHGDLTARKDVRKTTDEDIQFASPEGLTYLGGDVTTTNGDIIFENNVEANGEGWCWGKDQTFDADGWNRKLDARGSITKTTKGDLTLGGGDYDGYEYDVYLADDVTVQNGDLTIGDGWWDWERKDDTNVAAGKTLMASGNVEVFGYLGADGDLTIDAGEDVKLHTAVYADGDLDILASDDVYYWDGYYVEAEGNLMIDAGDNISIDGDLISGGDMLAQAGRDIEVQGDVDGDGNVTFDAGDDVKLHGDVFAGGDLEIYASDHTISLWGDVSALGDILLAANTEFKGWDDQFITAGGALTAEGYLNKINNHWCCFSDGSLYLYADGDISLADEVRAAGMWGEGCCLWTFGGGVSIISENGIIFTPDEEGGPTDTLNVPIIGRSIDIGGLENEAITDVGVDLPFGPGKAAIVLMSNGDLNLGDQAALTALGMYDIEFDMSNLNSWDEYYDYADMVLDKIGKYMDMEAFEADFMAYLEGLDISVYELYESEFPDAKPIIQAYYDMVLPNVDDRPGVNLLATPDAIGGVTRNPGTPIDVAIYAASTTGDVDVSGPVDIQTRREIVPVEYVEGQGYEGPPFECVEVPQGTMVIDAFDTVTFGESFIDSLVGDGVISRVGNRLEVVSRLSEWLFEAVGRLPYVYGGGPFVPGYTYVLRGAGLGNGAITDGRAWVLEDPPEDAPLSELAAVAAEQLTIGLEGCPVLVAAVSAELGIPSDTIVVSLANSSALYTDIQPCDSCARLINAAAVLRDEGGARMAALNQVFNELAPADAPFTPEMAASIVTAFEGRVNDGTQYAAAAQYIDAFVQYLAVLNNEMGSPVGDSLAFVMEKYGSGITESENSNIAAFIATRLEGGQTFTN